MRHGDATFSIPDGERMAAFSYRLVDEPEKVKAEAQKMVDDALERAERYRKHADRRGLGLDGFALCADYCLNTGPFLSPRRFAEFVTPYLAKLTQGYRDLGFYVIKHTDGNIMPIVDQLVQTKPHALHSIDPQAGVDIAEIKRRYGDQTLHHRQRQLRDARHRDRRRGDRLGALCAGAAVCRAAATSSPRATASTPGCGWRATS